MKMADFAWIDTVFDPPLVPGGRWRARHTWDGPAGAPVLLSLLDDGPAGYLYVENGRVIGYPWPLRIVDARPPGFFVSVVCQREDTALPVRLFFAARYWTRRTREVVMVRLILTAEIWRVCRFDPDTRPSFRSATWFWQNQLRRSQKERVSYDANRNEFHAGGRGRGA